MTHRWLITILLSTFWVEIQAEPAITNICFTSISLVGGSGQQVRLQGLANSGVRLLHERFPEFASSSNLQASVTIRLSGDATLVEFAWFGRPGERWYRVTCTLSGRAFNPEIHEYEALSRDARSSGRAPVSSDARAKSLR